MPEWIAQTQCRVASRLATFLVGDPGGVGTGSEQLSNLDPGAVTGQYVVCVPMKSQTVDETDGTTAAYTKDPVDEGFDDYVLQFGQDHTHLASQIQGEALLSGGVPALYDGERVSEYGFHYGPLLGAATTVGGDLVYEGHVSGELSAETLYLWVAIYTWLDARGVRHRSWLSNVFSHTTSAADPISVGFNVWNLSLTEHEDAYDQSQPVTIELYRAGGTTDGLYHLDQVLVNDRTTAYQWVTSTISDTDIESKQILYTDGDVLQDTTVPACKHLVTNRDRVWVVSADNPEILWYTKANGRDFILPGFNTSFVERTEVGRGVVALASLDDKLVVFKESQIYLYVGEGPNDQGVGGSLNGPNLISVETGCVDPRSVCTTPLGVTFQSRDSLYLLGRGLEVQKIGGPVEDYLDTYPTVTSAVHAPYLDAVLFTISNSGGTEGVTLVWHYQINEWTVWHTQDSRGTAKAPAIAGCLATRDKSHRYHQAQADGLVLWVDPTDYTEHDGSARSFTVTTPWFQFAQVQGFQKVRRITLLGTYQNVHKLDFSIYYDFNTTATSTYSLTAAQVAALRVGNREQVQLHLGAKCEAVRIEVTATLDGIGTGKLVRWESLLLELGGKGGSFRLPVEARR